jgi:hypothetical protein
MLSPAKLELSALMEGTGTDPAGGISLKANAREKDES